jgi:hypothetical protein
MNFDVTPYKMLLDAIVLTKNERHNKHIFVLD